MAVMFSVGLRKNGIVVQRLGPVKQQDLSVRGGLRREVPQEGRRGSLGIDLYPDFAQRFGREELGAPLGGDKVAEGEAAAGVVGQREGKIPTSLGEVLDPDE